MLLIGFIQLIGTFSFGIRSHLPRQLRQLPSSSLKKLCREELCRWYAGQVRVWMVKTWYSLKIGGVHPYVGVSENGVYHQKNINLKEEHDDSGLGRAWPLFFFIAFHFICFWRGDIPLLCHANWRTIVSCVYPNIDLVACTKIRSDQTLAAVSCRVPCHTAQRQLGAGKHLRRHTNTQLLPLNLNEFPLNPILYIYIYIHIYIYIYMYICIYVYMYKSH